jgi:hypothetical protein
MAGPTGGNKKGKGRARRCGRSGRHAFNAASCPGPCRGGFRGASRCLVAWLASSPCTNQKAGLWAAAPDKFLDQILRILARGLTM